MNAADLFYSFPRKIDLGLARVAAALEAFGRPQDLIPPVIHVAGTNGKGSTVAFLRAMAEAAGLAVHAYTSPHLVSIHERWRVAGRFIEEEALLDIGNRILALSNQIPLTVFEAETVAAFVAFNETMADLTLLEVGLGGRLDATNIVTKPKLTIITPVDFDHKEMLGDTLAKIAGEKAGILKPHVPCVVSRQADEALAVIERRAEALAAPLLVFGRDWDCYAERGRLIVQTQDRLLDLPLPGLAGHHQLENAGAAVVAMTLYGLDEAAIAQGVQNVSWPARMQRLQAGPFAEVAALAGAELWLDGGHNPHGAAAAASYMANLQAKDPRRLVLITGQLATKDPTGFFQAFQALKPEVITVPIRTSDAGRPPAELAELACAMGFDAKPADTPLEGLKIAVTQIEGPARVLICGSLYLAGDVLAEGPPLT
ncbi:MAG: bifunctional folylpolyglutamate synthase/dihydrofolate synthase [Aquidulcibacter sp.]|jgi:dihydrofolate synthase/folylpolyglutamate synthase|uniref:bifunctional folylpolyglutamate synthase/dihydrofolate synthase n=1 Tax=Aquidulcibacter sp. TaxID=2052990 RepID=UPI0022C06082|nr:bifunctional folylpolyglutamate synthase/dihydrofolate synthase [Aquidulcibacter sp.]